MIRRSTKPLWSLAHVLTAAIAVHAQLPKLTPDITGNYGAPTTADDYIKRDVMIPMRDGVRLHTVIVVPKGAKNAPMILTRTPVHAFRIASGQVPGHCSRRRLGAHLVSVVSQLPPTAPLRRCGTSS